MIYEVFHEDDNVRSKLTQDLGGITKVEFEVIARGLWPPFDIGNTLRLDTSVDTYEKRLPEILHSIAANCNALAVQVESRLGKEMTVDEMAEEDKD